MIKQNTLVTGSSGFIASALIKSLKSKEFNVLTVSIKPENLDINSNTFVNQNISYALKSCDVIYHLAARVHVMNDQASNSYDEYIKSNLLLTKVIAKMAIEACVKRFVFVSTIKVNGEYTIQNGFTEEDECAPVDAYALSKYLAELELKNLFKNSSTELVIIRCPLVYGPGVKANFKSLIKLCEKPIPLPLGCIENKRSLIYLGNLTDFMCLCGVHPNAANQTFLISDDCDLSTSELIRLIKRNLNRYSFLIPIPERLIRVLLKAIGFQNLSFRLCYSLQVNISKAKNLLGWKPPFTPEEGIKLTVKSYLD